MKTIRRWFTAAILGEPGGAPRVASWRTSLLAGIAFATLAHGSITAVTSTNPGNGSANAGSIDFGWQFNLSQVITVTDVGVFGTEDNGVYPANEVVIYQCPDTTCASGTAAVSGIVASDAPLDAAFFRYSLLDSPVVLDPGAYVITERSFGLPVTYDSFGPVFGTGISFVAERILLEDSSAFPTATGAFVGYFGPDFRYDLGDTQSSGVPEPSTCWLFAAALALVAPSILRRARK